MFNTKTLVALSVALGALIFTPGQEATAFNLGRPSGDTTEANAGAVGVGVGRGGDAESNANAGAVGVGVGGEGGDSTAVGIGKGGEGGDATSSSGAVAIQGQSVDNSDLVDIHNRNTNFGINAQEQTLDAFNPVFGGGEGLHIGDQRYFSPEANATATQFGVNLGVNHNEVLTGVVNYSPNSSVSSSNAQQDINFVTITDVRND